MPIFKFVLCVIAMLTLAACGLPIQPPDAALMRNYGGNGAPCATGCGR